MLLKFKIFILILFLSLFLSFSPVYSVEKSQSINQIMQQVGDVMTQLLPTLLNNKKFNNSNNVTIKHNIDKLSTLFSQAAPHFENQPGTLKISYDVLLAHILKAQKAYAKNQRYTQTLLKEVALICTSCHTQDNKERTLFKGTSRKSFDSDFEYAEFNYLTRDYKDAITYFDQFLQSVDDKTEEQSIVTALNRELLIFTQIYTKPDIGIQHFQRFLAKNNFTPYVNSILKQWIDGLQELEKSKLVKMDISKFDNLEIAVNQLLGSLDEPNEAILPTKKQQVAYIWLRGQLYRYLQHTHSEIEIPQLLFWLAIIDRATEYSQYYSFADLYLKECMLKYTQSPYAEMCFEEYKDYINFSFSGSSGTFIPEEIQTELKELEKIIYAK